MSSGRLEVGVTGYGGTSVEILRTGGFAGFVLTGAGSKSGKNPGMKSSTRLVMVAFIAGTGLGDGDELVWLWLEALGGTKILSDPDDLFVVGFGTLSAFSQLNFFLIIGTGFESVGVLGPELESWLEDSENIDPMGDELWGVEWSYSGYIGGGVVSTGD